MELRAETTLVKARRPSPAARPSPAHGLAGRLLVCLMLACCVLPCCLPASSGSRAAAGLLAARLQLRMAPGCAHLTADGIAVRMTAACLPSRSPASRSWLAA
jgi:hypothetical protein